MKRNNKKKNQLVGMQYLGMSGISKECQDAVMRLLQYGDSVTDVRILTCSNTHCLMLTVNVGDRIAIKSGFGSGYLGTGSHTFSYVLQLLEAHGAEIEEYEVDHDFIERLDMSALTTEDIAKLDTARPVLPSRWHDYIFEEDWDRDKNGTYGENLIRSSLLQSLIAASPIWLSASGKALTTVF